MLYFILLYYTILYYIVLYYIILILNYIILFYFIYVCLFIHTDIDISTHKVVAVSPATMGAHLSQSTWSSCTGSLTNQVSARSMSLRCAQASEFDLDNLGIPWAKQAAAASSSPPPPPPPSSSSPSSMSRPPLSHPSKVGISTACSPCSRV